MSELVWVHDDAALPLCQPVCDRSPAFGEMLLFASLNCALYDEVHCDTCMAEEKETGEGTATEQRSSQRHATDGQTGGQMSQTAATVSVVHASLAH